MVPYHSFLSFLIILLSFFLPALAHDPDTSLLFLAVHRTNRSQSVASSIGGGPFSPETGIRHVDFHTVGTDKILLNNIHSLLPLFHEDMKTTSGSPAPALPPLNVYNVYSWRGRGGITAEVQIAKKKTDAVILMKVGTDVNAVKTFPLLKGMVYLATCVDSTQCDVSEYRKTSWLDRLQQLKENTSVGPFADLLYQWIDAATTDPNAGDPWNALSLQQKGIVLDKEREFRKTALNEAEANWSKIKAMRNSAKKAKRNGNLLKYLKLWQLAQIRLNNVEASRLYAQSESMESTSLKNAMEALAKAKANTSLESSDERVDAMEIKLGKLLPRQKKVFHLEARSVENKAIALGLTSRLNSRPVVMEHMQTMWDELYELQKQSLDVFEYRLHLIQKGHENSVLFDNYGKVNTRENMERRRTSWAAAFQLKIDTLSTSAAKQKLTTPKSLPQADWNRADLLALEIILEWVEGLRQANERETMAADDVAKKLVAVFGDAEAVDGLPAKTEGDSNTEEMVQIAKESGRAYAAGVIKVLEDRKQAGGRLETSVEEYKKAIEALKRDNRADMPASVALSLDDWVDADVEASNLTVHGDDTFKYLQMMLPLIPTSPLFDTWHHLFIEALKAIFAQNVFAWDESKWTMAKLSTESVDKQNPHYLANESLVDCLLPQFFVDHLQRLIDDEPNVAVVLHNTEEVVRGGKQGGEEEDNNDRQPTEPAAPITTFVSTDSDPGSPAEKAKDNQVALHDTQGAVCGGTQKVGRP
eukprot:GHVS01050797.1.p1 GENE.GHVS01050797.1~~GHVS01050797.1.p1  ORF type:complete len:757 (-),score=119.66 GHVS01050797.1:296-2566(-)